MFAATRMRSKDQAVPFIFIPIRRGESGPNAMHGEDGWWITERFINGIAPDSSCSDDAQSVEQHAYDSCMAVVVKKKKAG